MAVQKVAEAATHMPWEACAGGEMAVERPKLIHIDVMVQVGPWLRNDGGPRPEIWGEGRVRHGTDISGAPWVRAEIPGAEGPSAQDLDEAHAWVRLVASVRGLDDALKTGGLRQGSSTRQHLWIRKEGVDPIRSKDGPHHVGHVSHRKPVAQERAACVLQPAPMSLAVGKALSHGISGVAQQPLTLGC